MKTAYGYVRVSSENQADSSLGLEAQRQRIRGYCELKSLLLAGNSGGPRCVYQGQTSIHSARRQHDFWRLARKSKPVVVVAKFDRLFRSVADAAPQTITDFDRRDIELVAIAEGFDMTNPYGRAMAQMASVFAELERAMIRERTKAAMNVKRGRNERMSHNIPFGWDEREEGILVQNEKEQRTIAWMRELKREGKSLRKIAALLNDQGVEPKRGKQWIHSSVLRILARTL